MTAAGPEQAGLDVRTLLRLDRLRLASAARRPAAGPIVALLLPLALLVGVLWMVGSTATPGLPDVESGILLGLLVSAPLAFSAYGTLFRADDQPFLRRLGIPADALYVERALRFLLLCAVAAVLSLLPFAASGQPLGRPAAVAVACVVGAWGGGLVSASLSARAMALRGGRGWGLLAVGIWDRQVAAIAPLLYAPLIPYGTGTVAAAWAAAGEGAAWGRPAGVLVLALGAAALARRWHREALPRFAPQALEMGFEPPPGGAGEMTPGRGVGRLLPRAAAAVWVRDTVVVNRRYAWAGRIVWPVAFVAFVALARWGAQPSTRVWVAGAALMALLVQAIAAIGLGRLERGGRRWFDRALGLTWPQRLLGRWAWGFGASLWLTVPLALAWGWWSGVDGGWAWVAAGAGTAALGATGSLAVAGWR